MCCTSKTGVSTVAPGGALNSTASCTIDDYSAVVLGLFKYSNFTHWDVPELGIFLRCVPDETRPLPM